MFVFASSFVSPSLAETQALVELDRFDARLPLTLAYSAGNCRLWISGTHVVYETALSGVRLSAHDTSSWGIALLTFQDRSLLAMTNVGSTWHLSGGSFQPVGQFRHRTDFLTDLTGGEILRTGDLILTYDNMPMLRVMDSTANERLRITLAGSGDVRDAAQDDATGFIYVLLRSAVSEQLLIFDEGYSLISALPLPEENGRAEGITVQPETGDVFISYLEPRQSMGQVVRYMIEPQLGSLELEDRPSYGCGIS